VIKPAHLLTLGLSFIFGIASNAQDPKHSNNGASAPSLATAKSISDGVETQIEDLRPFNHLASIAATSNPQTIKFESVKLTKVFTKAKSTSDQGYCKLLQFRDPGGSAYCPSTRREAPAPAYEVTYSYIGQQLASDEYSDRSSRFEFQVYFRPGELTPAVRSAISAGKTNRPELASYFKLTTARLPARFTVIDWANSSLCAGHHLPGMWTRHDPNCLDHISYKTVTRPSDYFTIRVEPVSM
jgi:hypothetical protein